MALTKCPECGHSVSDQAKTCPSCGYNLPRTVPAYATWAAVGVFLALIFFCLVLPQFSKPSKCKVCDRVIDGKLVPYGGNGLCENCARNEALKKIILDRD